MQDVFGGSDGSEAPCVASVGPGGQPFGLGHGQGFDFADLDAGAAKIAAVADDQGFALQPQDPEGAGLHTLAAGDAFVRIKNQAHILAVSC